MALKLSITTPHGILINESYHKITFIRFIPPKEVTVVISIYATEECRKNDLIPIDQKVIHLYDELIGSGTLLETLYNKLKTFPEYSGSEDV